MDNFNTLSSSDQLNGNFPQLPPEACLPEGIGSDACPWLDEYVDFSRIWSPESYAGYHEGCGLFLLSTVAARRVVFDLSGIRATNLNIALIGRTSIHAKSTTANIAIDLLDATGLDWLLAPDEITPQKLIADMSSNILPDNFKDLDDGAQQKAICRTLTAGQRGWFVDEFGDNISAMMRPESVMSGIKGLIRTLDGAPKQYEYGTISRGQNLINYPYLTTLGNITLADLAPFARRGTTLWGDGFFARFAMITPPCANLNYGRFPNEQRKFPDSLILPLVDWHKRLGLPEYQIVESNGKQILKFEPMVPKQLKISEEVFEAYYDYHDALRMIIWENQNQDLDGNYARLPEKALRNSAMFASLSNSNSIEINHWAKGQAIAEGWRIGLHEFYQQISDVNQDQSTKYIKSLPIEDQILRAIKINKMPDKREISQFTGFRKDIVEPALMKLISEGKVLVIQRGNTKRFILPGENE